MALAGFSAVMATAPTAGTAIGNQASASYVDSSGASQIATSNLVQTIVQQVGSFTLDGTNTGILTTPTVQNPLTGAAAGTVYAPHVLANTGNGSDTFNITVTPNTTNPLSGVAVYADPSGTGTPSGVALCQLTAAQVAAGNVCTLPAQTVAGNSQFQFVVAYQIPATATTPTTPYSYGEVAVTAGTPALYTAGATQSSDRDTVNLTTTAAFAMTKGIGTPSVAAPGGGAWPATPTSGQRSTSATCSTTWSAGLTSSATCDYTVYTLHFTNTGGAPGKLVFTDILPAGFTYVTGSSVWSNTGGTALNEAGGNAVVNNGIDYKVSGNTITGVVQSLGNNVTQTVSVVVLVNTGATLGTGSTTNVADYDPVDSPTATTTAPGTTASLTNNAAFTVTQSYGFAIGSTASTAPTALDTAAGTPNGSATVAGADTTVQPSVVAGGTVNFTDTVYNTGNGTDTLKLSILSSSFPAGTNFNFYAADGVTPLLNTTGTGGVDTGPIAAGGSTNIVVKATLPISATVGSGPLTAVVLGTSAGSPTTQTPGDATNDTVNTVVGSLVDITNTALGTGSGSTANGDLGPGPSPNPTTTNSTSAGVGTVFDLFVKNNDSTANTYNLAASQTTAFPGSLPAGWTVKFVASGGTCASAAIPDTGSVAAGTQVKVEACVTPPSTAVAATTNVYFQAQSQNAASNGVIVQDAKTDAVTVTAPVTYTATLTPNNTGQLAPGGTFPYPHTLTNTGTQACTGSFTATATLPAADVTAGWTAAVYVDTNGNGQLDAADTLVTGPVAGPLASGAVEKFLVKVQAPLGASAGAQDTATLTVVDNGSPSCTGVTGLTATDVSTVISGQIRAVKTQALDANCDGVADGAFAATTLTAKPGQCLIYQIVATNQGSAPVTNLTVNDALPAFTALAPTQPSNQCVSSGVTGTALTYSSTPTAVNCGSAANSVAPGGTATLTFGVQINQ